MQNRFKQQPDKAASQPWTTQLPVHGSWGVYARQSTPAQLINHAESTEMQTDDLIDWLVKRGTLQENISLYDADLGMSGTLRIDQRSDLQRLVADIATGTIQAVMVYQISRLFRDETGVQYNVFADTCKQHGCILVTADGMIFNFSIPLCVKLFRMLAEMAADFIPQQIGLLHAARLRKARKGYYAGLGPVPSGFRIDTDKSSPTYKKITPIPTHKAVLRELYYRFYELGVEQKAKFFRELDSLPYIFPDFPADIDHATQGSNRRRKVTGGYHMSRYAIERMLCNPANIGWWIVRGEIISKNNHEPLLTPEEEYLFWYAFDTLSPHTTDGAVNEKRVIHPARYTHTRPQREPAGLLKYRISAPQGQVYVHWNKKVCAYKIMLDPSRVMRKSDTEIEVSAVDTVFSDMFFARLRTTHDFDNYRDWLNGEINNRQKETATLTNQLQTLATLEEAVQDEILAIRVEVKQSTITEEEAQPQIARLRAKLAKLDAQRRELAAKQTAYTAETDLEKAARTLRKLGTFQDELEILIETWEKKPVAVRQEFINLFVQEAALEMLSPRWVKLTINWTYPYWQQDTKYIFRKRGKAPFWTEEEKALVRKLYPTADTITVLEQLPTKSWASIRIEAMLLGVRRERTDRQAVPIPLHESLQDYEITKQVAALQTDLNCQELTSVKTE